MSDRDQGITSGLAAIDDLLPGRGYQRGALIEWLVPGGHTMGYGAELLSLQVAQRAATNGKAIVILDPAGEFYPPAARRMGLPLEQLVILRGRKREDLYWSLDQALRCEAVAAVWAATTSAFPDFLVDLDERWQRRFQLSAESSGAIGLFLRPDVVARQPTWSEIQWLVRAPSVKSFGSQVTCSDARQALSDEYWQRPISLQLLKCRGGRSGQVVHFNLDTRSGVLRSDNQRRGARVPHRIQQQMSRPATRLTSPPPTTRRTG